MRTYTIVVSIVAHTLVVMAVIVNTAIATDVLPEPRRASEFILVEARPVDVPPPAPRPTRTQRPVSPDAAPLDAPVAVHPEIPIAADDVAPDFDPAVIQGLATAAAADVIAPPPQPTVAPPPIHVGGRIQQPRKVRDAAPVYPMIAQSARVSGIVILEAVIAEDGSVRDVRVLRSIPLLDQAAIDAVRQWRFTPTLLNGEAVPIVMTVTVGFNLR
jgi:periplasmic protein TonB